MTDAAPSVREPKRRYRGCEIAPGRVRAHMGFGPEGGLVPGWVTTCRCGLEIGRGTQSELREAITSHQWYGRPAPCVVAGRPTR